MQPTFYRKWAGKMGKDWVKIKKEYLIVFKSKEEMKIKDQEKMMITNLNGMIIGGKTLLIKLFKI